MQLSQQNRLSLRVSSPIGPVLRARCRSGPTLLIGSPVNTELHRRGVKVAVVYYGDERSELSGTYVYGDHSTGKIWDIRHDGARVVSAKGIGRHSTANHRLCG